MSTAEHIAERMRQVRRLFEADPSAARMVDVAVRASWRGGLSIRATDAHGHAVETDMPVEIGGGGRGMSPGSLLRGALATCDATRIAMAAAERGIELSELSVEVTSVSDERGLLGIGGVTPGPAEIRVRYRLASPSANAAALRDLVDEADRYSPVLSALRREVPVRVDLDLEPG